MRRLMVIAMLAIATPIGVGCGGSGEATAGPCQTAQKAFLSTPASAAGLIARRHHAVRDACGPDSPQLLRDGRMLQREAVLDQEYPTPLQLAKRAVSPTHGRR